MIQKWIASLTMMMCLANPIAALAGCTSAEDEEVSLAGVAATIVLQDNGYSIYERNGPWCVPTNIWMGNDIHHVAGSDYMFIAYASKYSPDTDSRVKNGDGTVISTDTSTATYAGNQYYVYRSGIMRVELKSLSTYRDVAVGWTIGRKSR